MSSSSEFKAVNVRRNTVKVTKHNGEKFTAQMPSNSKAFEYAEQLRNYLPENHVHSFERGDGVTWVKTNSVLLHTPITFHNYQKVVMVGSNSLAKQYFFILQKRMRSTTITDRIAMSVIIASKKGCQKK